MKCKHQGLRMMCASVEYMPGVEARWMDHHQDTGAPIRRVIVAAHRCMDCGYWLGHGEANDTDERAGVEKRAAELAAIALWWNDPQHESESYGAICFHNGGTPGDDDDGGSSEWVADEWAGYLARVIATHDQEEEG